jgi:hypothetical protein
MEVIHKNGKLKKEAKKVEDKCEMANVIILYAPSCGT